MIVVGRDGIVNLECIGRRLEVVTVEILYLGRELKQRCQDTSDVGANDSTLGSMVPFPQPSPWQYEKKKGKYLRTSVGLPTARFAVT